MTLAKQLPVFAPAQHKASWHFGPALANLWMQNETPDETPSQNKGLTSAYRDPFRSACVLTVGDYTRTSCSSGQLLLTDCPGIAALVVSSLDTLVLGYGLYFGAWRLAVVDAQPFNRTTGAGYSNIQPAYEYAPSAASVVDKQDLAPTSGGELRAKRIASIQGSFALPMRALAKILGRSPTQLYKWLDPEEVVSLQESSEQRIAIIEQLARSWDEQSKAPIGELRRQVLSSGKTIVDILSANPIDEPLAEKALTEIARQFKAHPLSLAQRLKQKGFVRRRRQLPDDDD
jgi:hypothetical protein